MEALLEDIIAQIKESEIKLGYCAETIRLYYKLDGLVSRLGEDFQSVELAAEALSQRAELQQTELGPLAFRATRGRVEVTITPAGVAYVHESVPTPPFLVDLVELFGPCGHATIEQVKELFNRYGEHAIEGAPPTADFDFVMYFTGGEDTYRYCFKDEGGMLTYHRLSFSDYNSRTRA